MFVRVTGYNNTVDIRPLYIIIIIQVYSSSKPCSGCGSDMTSSNRTAYWEGGKGCRSTAKMNRYKHELSYCYNYNDH